MRGAARRERQMEGAGTLQLLAELAVGFLGFSGVVVRQSGSDHSRHVRPHSAGPSADFRKKDRASRERPCLPTLEKPREERACQRGSGIFWSDVSKAEQEKFEEVVDESSWRSGYGTDGAISGCGAAGGRCSQRHLTHPQALPGSHQPPSATAAANQPDAHAGFARNTQPTHHRFSPRAPATSPSAAGALTGRG